MERKGGKVPVVEKCDERGLFKSFLKEKKERKRER
jgi:hypothetical protein